MSPKAQRIAIGRAERPDLKDLPIDWTYTGCDDYTKGWCWVKKVNAYRTECIEVPDYLDDLNAMHEAEKILTLESGQYRDYQLHLRQVLIVSGRLVCSVAEEHRFLTANAAQRAEAFLRTLNLWDDSK